MSKPICFWCDKEIEDDVYLRNQRFNQDAHEKCAAKFRGDIEELENLGIIEGAQK